MARLAWEVAGYCLLAAAPQAPHGTESQAAPHAVPSGRSAGQSRALRGDAGHSSANGPLMGRQRSRSDGGTAGAAAAPGLQSGAGGSGMPSSPRLTALDVRTDWGFSNLGTTATGPPELSPGDQVLARATAAGGCLLNLSGYAAAQQGSGGSSMSAAAGGIGDVQQEKVVQDVCGLRSTWCPVWRALEELMQIAGQCLTSMSATQQQQQQIIQETEQQAEERKENQQQLTQGEGTGEVGVGQGQKQQQHAGKGKSGSGSATSSTSSNGSLSEVLVATLPLMLHYCCSILANLTQQSSGRLALSHQPGSFQVLLQVLQLNDEPSAAAALGVLCNYCMSNVGAAAADGMQRGSTAAATKMQMCGSISGFGSVVGVEGVIDGAAGQQQQQQQQGMKKSRSIGGGLSKQGDGGASHNSNGILGGSQAGIAGPGGAGAVGNDPMPLPIEDGSLIVIGEGVGTNLPGAVTSSYSGDVPGHENQPMLSGLVADTGGPRPVAKLSDRGELLSETYSKEGLQSELVQLLNDAEPQLAFWANVGGTQKLRHMASWLVKQQQGFQL